MEESIGPSVPFLEVSSLNTWDDTIRTELDSHANMIVLGRHCFVFILALLSEPCLIFPATRDMPFLETPSLHLIALRLLFESIC